MIKQTIARKGRSVRIASTTLLLLATAAATFGHDTWLMPERLAAKPGSVLTINMTSGMAFPALDYAIRPQRVKVARCRLAGTTTELTKKTSGAKSLRFQLPLRRAGIATVWVETGPPKTVDLSPNQVREYVGEIDAAPSVRRRWESQAAKPRRWRERYSKHSKTFVRVGDAANDASWKTPVGMSLEIVLEQDPRDVPMGGPLAARVLKNGKPLANFALGLLREGQKVGRFRRTDAAGGVAFPMTQRGRYLLRGTELRPSNERNLEWESDFTTLTFEYRPKSG